MNMYMKNQRRILSIFLALLMSLTLLVGCSSNDDLEEVKIGVAVSTWDARTLAAKEYYAYLSDELNIDFIYSEEAAAVESVLSFVENAYNAGASGIIDLAIEAASDAEQICAKCDELGIYYASYYVGSDEYQKDFEYGLGSVAGDTDALNTLFYDLVASGLQDGETHSMVLCPVAARWFNTQQMNNSMAAFRAFNDQYSLGFTEEEISEMIMVDATTYVDTGRDDVKLAIYPLFTGDGLSEIIKTGEYDMVVVAGNIYLRFESAILEAEKANNLDIHLYAMTNVGETTLESFRAKDAFGNPSLNGVCVDSPIEEPILLALVLNGIYGDADAVKANGVATPYLYKSWVCKDIESYEGVNRINTEESCYVINADEFKNMVKRFNDQVNPEYLMDYIEQMNDLEGIYERRSMN